MPATAHTARHPLTLALRDRLNTVERLTVYIGEIPDSTPEDPGPHPPVLPGPSGRVAPYAVIYPGPGLPDPNPNFDLTPADFDWSVQTTLVAGYSEDLDALLDDVVPLLHHWRPDNVDGVNCGPLRHPDGYRPGLVLRDRQVQPHRFSAPLPWQLHVVTA